LRLSYNSPEELVFGKALHPLRYGLGLQVGAGRVIPELKYWLPREQEEETEKIPEHYTLLLREVLERGVNLGLEELQLDLELSYYLTMNPGIAGEVVGQHLALMEEYHSKYGMKLGLRVTVADIRGARGVTAQEALARMLESFEVCRGGGANVLSIESIGGKILFNESLIRGDLEGVVGSLLLATLDVGDLWREIVRICGSECLPGGDSACGFGNTAMILAGGMVRKQIPHVLAAVVRAMSLPRTLRSFEEGARGPGKDCAYENVYIKIITGLPVSMEGKSSACAHSSLVGNVTASVCDLWSNEQVEGLRLYGGSAPATFLEILAYDTRLLNTASERGMEKELRDLLVASDASRDPQALVLSPAPAFQIAEEVIAGSDPYGRIIRAGLKALEIIKSTPGLHLPPAEQGYVEKLKLSLAKLPEDPSKLLSQAMSRYGQKLPEHERELFRRF
jgi:methanol--5-hydroxybenzimidazolylcobamide Co-methyltransferase